MADEQAQTEVVDTPVSEVVDASEEVQLESDDSNVSEDDTNSEEDDSSGGDLRVALRQERQRRQMLEAQLRDPNAVYQIARQLGLTEEQAEAQANASQYMTPQQVDAQVTLSLAKAESLKKYPDLKKNEEDQIAVSALANSKFKGDLLKAADKYYARFNQVKTQAKTEGITQAKTEITAKEQAQTAPIAVAQDSDATAMADLKARMKSFDKKTQEKAYTEWIMLKNKK